MRRLILGTGLVLTLLAAGGRSASAHTESDLVAVPAGSEVTVTLKPTHGCAGSPTVEVRIRADVADAVAVAVPGWTSTQEPDGSGRTIASWRDGLLPADEAGAFPIEFVVPDRPGELLLFPSVQRCEDGSELAWISGDPTSEYPAPRLLVLPPGFESAATIDEVPADAPGREQLAEIVDVDNAAAPPTEPPPAGTDAPVATEVPVTADSTASTPASDPTTAAPTVSEPTPSVVTATSSEDSDGGGVLWWVIGVAAVAIGAAVVWLVRRRSRSDASSQGSAGSGPADGHDDRPPANG
jgi:uncharacterized protein YcnI